MCQPYGAMDPSGMALLARRATEMFQRLLDSQSTPIRPHTQTNSSGRLTDRGAAGGSRTHKSLQTMVFETIAVAISPPPRTPIMTVELQEPCYACLLTNLPRDTL